MCAMMTQETKLFVRTRRALYENEKLRTKTITKTITKTKNFVPNLFNFLEHEINKKNENS